MFKNGKQIRKARDIRNMGEDKKKRPNAGRPNMYETVIKPHIEEIKEMLANGMQEQEIARTFGINPATLCEYKKRYPEFAKTVSEARIKKVGEVKAALLKKALGFEYEETKTYIKKDAETGKMAQYTEKTKKYCPPDTGAIAMYLRNYDSSWHDKDSIEIEFRKMEMELRKQMAEAKDW